MFFFIVLAPGLDIILQHVHSRVKMNDYPLLLQVVVRPGVHTV